MAASGVIDCLLVEIVIRSVQIGGPQYFGHRFGHGLEIQFPLPGYAERVSLYRLQPVESRRCDRNCQYKNAGCADGHHPHRRNGYGVSRIGSNTCSLKTFRPLSAVMHRRNQPACDGGTHDLAPGHSLLIAQAKGKLQSDRRYENRKPHERATVLESYAGFAAPRMADSPI